MHVRVSLGLAGVFALLAACGPARPTSGPGDDEGDADEGDADEGDTAEGDTDEGNDTSTPEMCTVENYADDPQLLGHTRLRCFPAEPDGTCAGCDVECMESVVYNCLDCAGVEPDTPCHGQCIDHVLLCSEQLGDQCCYLVTAKFNGAVPGRPLREHGAALLPSLEVVGLAHRQSGLAGAAALYREFARYERASVDAFLHAAAVLDQLGAPRELLEAHRDAAREEADHARLALAAARALDGREASLGPVPPASQEFDLGAFVRDLVHDGCIGELVAAGEARWALEQASVREHEALARYWRPVAEEEAAHANLAWRTLEWLLTAQPELASLASRELAVATAAQADSGAPGVDMYGLASGGTKARLRELAIAQLIADARDASSKGCES